MINNNNLSFSLSTVLPLTTTTSTLINNILTSTEQKYVTKFTTMFNKNFEDECQYFPPAYLEERFWLVTVVGTSVAIISVVENLFLFYLLTRK